MPERIRAIKFGVIALCLSAAGLSAIAQTSTTPQTTTPQKPSTTTSSSSASSSSAPASQSGADDVTDVTVFLKKKSSIPEQNMRIDTRSASACGFIGSDGGISDYIADYIRDTTGTYDISDPNNFSETSPLGGDASRESTNTATDPTASDDSSSEASTGGCTSTDRAFAAGRATILRRDKTIHQAFDFYDQKKYAEALDMFKTAYAKIGYEDAAFYIGKMYIEGLGAAKNGKEAVVWLRKVAEQPFDPGKPHPFDPKDPEYMNTRADATMTLAKIYLAGFGGVTRDPKEALKWFQKAADIGYIPASKIVGDYYYYGNSVTKDVKRAVKNYQQAATFGYAPAQFALADILAVGEDDVKADPQKALAWYNEAAKANHPGALYALAVAYDTGEGVPADPQRALVLYKEAAIRGNADAQNAVGTYFYQGGTILPKDDTAARQWFEVAARNRQADAAFNLAVMYTKGEGGAKDMVKAYVWFRAARLYGHENADAALKSIEGRMSEAEKAEVQKLFAPRS